MNNFIIHYGKLLSDQGQNFNSEVVQVLCKLRYEILYTTLGAMEFQKGLTERCMLGTLETEQKQNWKKYLQPIMQ